MIDGENPKENQLRQEDEQNECTEDHLKSQRGIKLVRTY